MDFRDFDFICKQNRVDRDKALGDDFIKKVLKKDKGKSSIFRQITINTYLQSNKDKFKK